MIPFNKPPNPRSLFSRLGEVAESGHHSGDGPMSRRAREMLEDLHTGCAAVLLTTSCTHALELSALTLDVGVGDEVIVPSFTFVSTANAFALRGATIRFADIDETSLNISPESVSELLTARTKVIVPVHYAGFGCDMTALGVLADSVGAAVVEDNAHGLFGSLNGKPLGTFGSMSTLSFHETKNISAGEGGALVINDPDYVLRSEIAREKGTNRSQFFRGMVDKYSWVSLGSSWLPSEFTAAAVVAGLENASVSQTARMHAWNRYYAEIADWARSNGVRMPNIGDQRVHPAHMFYLLLPDVQSRSRFIDHLRVEGVQSVFHYVPLHTALAAERYASPVLSCPVTDRVSDCLVRLPLFADISDREIDTVVESVLKFVP